MESIHKPNLESANPKPRAKYGSLVGQHLPPGVTFRHGIRYELPWGKTIYPAADQALRDFQSQCRYIQMRTLVKFVMQNKDKYSGIFHDDGRRVRMVERVASVRLRKYIEHRGWDWYTPTVFRVPDEYLAESNHSL